MIGGYIIPLMMLLIGIVGAFIVIIPVALIYRIAKKHWPDWQILVIIGILGGIITVILSL